jgi:3-oxoadipate enol-lactonase
MSANTAAPLFVEDHNPGGSPAAILIHGLGSSSDSWQLQVPALTAEGYRVLVPDLPGFGRSPYAGRLSVAQMAAAVAWALENHGTGPAVVVGISMGGTVGLQLAVDRPSLVSRLVLVNTFARLRPLRPSGWLVFASRLFLVTVTGLPAQADFVSRRIFPGPDQEPLRRQLYEEIVASDPRAYRSSVLALARFDLEDRLATLRVPTLIVTGANDNTVAPANQARLLAIPGSRQVVIPGAGHGVIADQPEAFNAALMGFLKSGVPHP